MGEGVGGGGEGDTRLDSKPTIFYIFYTCRFCFFDFFLFMCVTHVFL